MLEHPLILTIVAVLRIATIACIVVLFVGAFSPVELIEKWYVDTAWTIGMIGFFVVGIYDLSTWVSERR